MLVQQVGVRLGEGLLGEGAGLVQLEWPLLGQLGLRGGGLGHGGEGHQLVQLEVDLRGGGAHRGVGGGGGHVTVLEIGRLVEEGGGGVIVSIFSIRMGSLGSCCSGELTPGAAAEAGGSWMTAGMVWCMGRLVLLLRLKVWL